VEQQALLQPRERVDVLNLPRTPNRANQTVELMLANAAFFFSALMNVHRFGSALKR
jgi:hypothetical protein